MAIGNRHRVHFLSAHGPSIVALAVLLLLMQSQVRGDEVELHDGRKFTGTVVSQHAGGLVFRVVYPNGGTLERTFSTSDVKSVRKMPLPEPAKTVTPKPTPAPVPKPPPPKDPVHEDRGDAPEPDEDEEEPANLNSGVTTPATPTAMGRADIEALIDKMGKEPPDWWDSVNLNTPATMDMTWPLKPGGKWNPQRNISQYFISIINPRPARHKEGCKFMHQVLSENRNSRDVQARAMQMLGRIYGIYLHDYARGVFWYRKAAKAGAMNTSDVADLAFYCWKLGSREMALAELGRSGQINGRTVRVLGAIGETARALQLATLIARSYPDEGGLAGADVCRINGRFAEAAQWFQRVLSIPQPREQKQMARWQRYNDRARGGLEACQALAQFDLAKAADGTYTGDGGGFRGPVSVQVVIKSGRIENVKVIQDKEDWPLNALVAVPAQIIEKQSLKGVDSVSGATCTAEAVFIGAGKAMASAPRK